MGFFTTLKSLFGLNNSANHKVAPGDRLLVCLDCKKQFVFDAGEQRFFKEKGFTDPKRCPECRKNVRSRMRRRGRRHQHNGQARHQDHNRPHNGHRRHSRIDGDSPYADER